MAVRRAFTLIELIVALAIAVILAGIAIPVYSAVEAQAQNKALVAQASGLAQAVSSFYAVNGCYPPDVGAGVMPQGLGPYVGNAWPSGFDYQAWSSVTPPAGVGSGSTAYYIGVTAPTGDTVWIVWNSPVPTC